MYWRILFHKRGNQNKIHRIGNGVEGTKNIAQQNIAANSLMLFLQYQQHSPAYTKQQTYGFIICKFFFGKPHCQDGDKDWCGED